MISYDKKMDDFTCDINDNLELRGYVDKYYFENAADFDKEKGAIALFIYNKTTKDFNFVENVEKNECFDFNENFVIVLDQDENTDIRCYDIEKQKLDYYADVTEIETLNKNYTKILKLVK